MEPPKNLDFLNKTRSGQGKAKLQSVTEFGRLKHFQVLKFIGKRAKEWNLILILF